jgi:hypothetical protein
MNLKIQIAFYSLSGIAMLTAIIMGILGLMRTDGDLVFWAVWILMSSGILYAGGKGIGRAEVKISKEQWDNRFKIQQEEKQNE